MCMFKLGSIAQQLDIDYTRREGQFVVFIEDEYWNPRAFMTEPYISGDGSHMDPCTSFYNAVFSSMGHLLKLKPEESYEARMAFYHGETLISMPYIQTIRSDHWAVSSVTEYQSKVNLDLDKIFENRKFYDFSISGSTVGNVSSVLDCSYMLRLSYLICVRSSFSG